jgi:hypothetical protein
MREAAIAAIWVRFETKLADHGSQTEKFKTPAFETPMGVVNRSMTKLEMTR